MMSAADGDDAGGVYVTMAVRPLPSSSTATPVGAPGKPGTTTVVFVAGPVPTALVAVTAHVYVVAGDRVATTNGDRVPVAVRATPPFVEVQLARYEVMGAPPFDSGAWKRMTAARLLWSIDDVTEVGAPGAVGAVAAFDGNDEIGRAHV